VIEHFAEKGVAEYGQINDKQKKEQVESRWQV